LEGRKIDKLQELLGLSLQLRRHKIFMEVDYPQLPSVDQVAYNLVVEGDFRWLDVMPIWGIPHRTTSP
jgi:hypothetical protein